MPQNCVAICKISNHNSLFIPLSPDRECVMLALDKSNHCVSQNAFFHHHTYLLLLIIPAMCYVFSTHKEQADVFHLHDFLILDLRKKKKEKRNCQELRHAQRAWEWHWPSHTGMCVHEVSGTRANGFTFPQALSCIGEKAPGTAMGDFTRARVLGELCTIGAKDLFRKLLWPKMLGWTCADLGHCAGLLSSMQTLFHPFGLLPPSNFSSAHKLYCVPNSFSASFPIHRLCSFLLPDGPD